MSNLEHSVYRNDRLARIKRWKQVYRFFGKTLKCKAWEKKKKIYIGQIFFDGKRITYDEYVSKNQSNIVNVKIVNKEQVMRGIK